MWAGVRFPDVLMAYNQQHTIRQSPWPAVYFLSPEIPVLLDRFRMLQGDARPPSSVLRSPELSQV
jgi:hypothetical protein